MQIPLEKTKAISADAGRRLPANAIDHVLCWRARPKEEPRTVTSACSGVHQRTARRTSIVHAAEMPSTGSIEKVVPLVVEPADASQNYSSLDDGVDANGTGARRGQT